MIFSTVEKNDLLHGNTLNIDAVNKLENKSYKHIIWPSDKDKTICTNKFGEYSYFPNDCCEMIQLIIEEH